MASKGNIILEINLDHTNTTFAQFQKMVVPDIVKLASVTSITHIPVWKNHQRDMTEGWQYAGTAEEFRESWDWNQLGEPGTYALVLDPKAECANPVLDYRTILFGETTISIRKRANCSTGAIRGIITNQTTKWEGIRDIVCEAYDVAVVRPKDIRLFYRPHSVSDPKFAKLLEHSREMETQAHAMWQVLHGQITTANTRDLPTEDHLKKARAYLKKLGYSV